MFSIEEIINATKANVLKKELDKGSFEISTDTRTIGEGQIYLPLKGPNFDGEDFIPQAIDNGAAGYFTKRDYILENSKLVLQVSDCLRAYLDLAKYYKTKINPKTIAITGSSGKTTTKEMMASVMSEAFKTHKTEMNFNNEIGLCKTILSMPEDTEVLVLEMGMRGFGEIDFLSSYANPDVALITNVGTAHIGRLGSRANIARAKCEIKNYLNDNGVFIAPNDELIKNNVQDGIFINPEDAEIIERRIGFTAFNYKGFRYELNIEGDYNVQNALGVIEAAKFLGISEEKIADGLRKFTPVGNRWDVREIKGYKIINDSYNANPDSMLAVIKTVMQNYDKPILFVLGNMGELGKDEVLYHQKVGIFLSDSITDGVSVVTVGDLAHEISDVLNNIGKTSPNFETNEDAAKYILDNVPVGTTIILKASHSMQFEKILDYLKR
ncbi:UDP-N-acetylmuramoyl-tripeptide--D-alanyl-D-alanine ligase [bacterium]|nr:UDP-N-acetylmuramoyl-tripeptide--D-alanyl-D-alanine ligase [bacterium]